VDTRTVFFIVGVKQLNNHVPKTIHMEVNASEPYLIHHLKAVQCGEVTRNGDVINPKRVSSLQNFEYK